MPPGCTGVFSTKPVFELPTSVVVEGLPWVRTPGDVKASLTTFSAALTVPRVGSSLNISRQMTPAANSEIAIGMNTAVLKAVDQRMRSVSTAKTSPIAVTSAGTTASQIALFLIAVLSVSVVKRSL